MRVAQPAGDGLATVGSDDIGRNRVKDPAMANGDFGANEFTFTGDRTSITFFPQTPGPVIVGHEGGELRYQGPEGDLTFFGQQITRLDSALGTLLTVALPSNPDVGAMGRSA